MLEDADRVFPHEDAGADLAQLAAAFVEAHAPTALRECGSDGQPAEAAACDLCVTHLRWHVKRPSTDRDMVRTAATAPRSGLADDKK
ncbi:hypothetical protein Pme01_12370 [Planosporangium mesophilum]|uniref:Uncharacterized protein n=1 Tax=Planosporangium mesophilum TaxID=689768 RepID=A0A8J3T6V9_9ACTN|nr:hypothetical protein Pme01_12370 [Planosporangium mesophilum]